MKSSSLKKLLYLALMPGTMMMCSCGGDDSVDPEPEPTASVSAESLTFSSYEGGETQEFTITSSNYATMVVTAKDNWCVIERKHGSTKGEYIFAVTPTTNFDDQTRSTQISIKVGTADLPSIAVTQAGGPAVDTSSAGLWGTVGWNFGNQMDAHNNGVAGETAWGNPRGNQGTFDNVKKAGFKTVRIPVTWMGHIGDAPEYKIEEAWLNRVAELVGYCKNAGLNAIINIHHDGAESKYWLSIKEATASAEKEAAITAELTALWKQIAEKFKNTGDWLMFETMNEIHDGGWGWGDNKNDGGKQYAVLNRWNQACVDAIRSVGGENTNRWIGVPGYSTNIDLTVENLTVPTDASNRVAVAVHNYDPYAFTLECSKDEYASSDINNLKTQFDKLKKTYLDKGIQCYIGECGCAQRANADKEINRLTYLAEFAKAAKAAGLSIILWDNNSDSNGKGGSESNAFLNHGTGQYYSTKGKAATRAFVLGYK